MTKKRILMLRTDWSTNKEREEKNLYGGIGYYRIVKPAQFLTDQFDIDVMGKDFMDLGETQEQRMFKVFHKYDLVYLRQIDNPRGASDFIACGRHFGIPVLLDLDDNLFAIREDNPSYAEYHPGSQRAIILKTVCSLVDGMAVSTDPLKDVYKQVNKKVDVLPNLNDVNDWKFEKKQWNDDKVRIGWAGSLTHDNDLKMVIPAIRQILEMHPHVEFHMMGGVSVDKIPEFVELFKPYGNRIKFFAGTPSWEGYPKLLAETGWDIAIAPLVDDEFNRGKSHIKWMEYSMYQIPVVASQTYPYYKKVKGLKTIQDGKTGFLATSLRDWVEYLDLLVNNVRLRQEIGYNAYKYISENWQWKDNIHLWADVFNKYLK